ncbi:MAG: HlyC/CorC family transporter [Candidatus Lindowbacteria bacterium]|nr:HlyC/CorC family transporter [Candidatus Lindowbacteria bacterium]
MYLFGLIAAVAGLYVISGLMSGSETALFSLKPHDLELLEEKGSRAGKLIEQPQRLLVVILFSNLFVNTLAASLMETAAARVFPAGSVGVAIALGTVAVLIFGEVAPKTLALKQNVAFASFTAPAIRALDIILRPLSVLLVAFTKFISTRFEGGEDERITEEDIKALVAHSEDIGALDRAEEKWIHSIFELDKKRAHDLMTPRDEIFALPRNISFDDALEKISESGFSRIPLYAGSIEQTVGILYARDLLITKARGLKTSPARLARKALFIADMNRGDMILNELRSHKVHLAMVANEFGNIVGIITLEDILEAIVGEIRDKRREGITTPS